MSWPRPHVSGGFSPMGPPLMSPPLMGPPFQAAPAPALTGHPARSVSSSATAPRLESGWLAWPHLGDCTHDGQPASQSQLAMAALVARSHSAAAVEPRSADPAPPAR